MQNKLGQYAYVGICIKDNYSQTSLIRSSLIRMPHDPNTVHGNFFYYFLFTMIQ